MKKNILLLVNDHQAYYGHDVCSFGPKIHHPNLDRLAREGITFSHTTSACPLCVPARRSMLTGLHPHHHRQYNNDEAPFDGQEIYLEHLKEAGYDTSYFGKWHAGPGTAKDFGCKGFVYPG